MVTTDENGLREYKTLFGEGLKILESIPVQIENKARSIRFSDELSAAICAEIDVTKVLLVRRAVDILSFLKETIEQFDERHMHVLTLYIRPLIDIYSRSLFMSSKPSETIIKTITADRFITLSEMARYSSTPSGDIEKTYREYREATKNIIDYSDLEIPENLNQLSKKSLQRQKAIFPSVEQILNEQSIKKYAPKSSIMWPNISKSTYEMYRKFSNFIHPNPLVGHTTGTEIFWIVSTGIIIISLIIETINTSTLENSTLIDEMDVWHKKIKDAGKSFVFDFQSRR